MNNYKDKQLLEDIYDVIKVTALSDNQIDDYAYMSRKHAKEASKGLHDFLKDKNIEWSGDDNTIRIGKHITIRVEYS